MSHPGRSYLAAISHPFETEAHLNKVPVGGSATQPVTVRSTFDFAIGTGGVGFVSCKPNLNTRDSLQFTNAAFTSTNPAFPNTNIAVVGVTGINVAKPYSIVQLTTTFPGSADYAMQYRLVSAGVRIHYTGAELNRSGTAYTITTPTNSDVVGVNALQLYTQHPEVGKVSVAEHGVIEVSWHGKSDAQLRMIDLGTAGLDFAPASPAVNSTTSYWDYTAAGATGGGSAFGVIINGAVPGTTFTGEYIEHWEFSGNNVGTLATPSISDPSSVSHAHTIMSQALCSMATASSGDRTEHIAQSVVDVVKRYEPSLIAAGTAMFGPEATPVLAAGATFVNKFSHGIVKTVGGIAAGIRHMFGIHHH